MEGLAKPWDDIGGSADLPSLPSYVRTKHGQFISTDGSIWHLLSLDRGVNYIIDWSRLEGPEKQPIFSSRARHLLKLYLADTLSRKKAVTTWAHYNTFVIFERWLQNEANSILKRTEARCLDWSDLDEKIIRTFLSWRSEQTVDAIQSLCHLRCLYAWGVARQYLDFSPHTLHVLRSIKMRNHPSGHNVRFRHPVKGPFAPDEILLIRNAIKRGSGSEQDRALVMLHLELGINPYATIQILNRDLKRYNTGDGTYYQINVPRIKKRTIHRETRRRPISKELGELLVRLQQGSPEEPLIYWLPQPGAERAISKAMRRFAVTANIISPRTGILLRLSSRRFRYTLATHMAEEGASKYHIAEILDHTDLQNVKVYVEVVSSIAEPVARATDSVLGSVVRRFLGKVVDSTEIPAFNGIPNALIPATTPHLPLVVLNAGGVGLCGRDVRKDGLCRLFPPLSCYLCPSFAALRTGPHKEMLASIEAFIQQTQGSVDNRILKQLDDIRFAIKEVLEQLDLKE